MVELSTLFTPHSDLQLDHAFYINDRGEIAARGCCPTAIFVRSC